MDIPEVKVNASVVSPDSVSLPRGDYNELLQARFAIHLIGTSVSKYGPDRDVLNCVLTAFGYPLTLKEAEADA